MYRCEMCGELTKPGSPSYKVVTETRERTYLPPSDPPNNRGRGRGRRSRRPSSPSDGTGHEIVTEKLVCADCAASVEKEEGPVSAGV